MTQIAILQESADDRGQILACTIAAARAYPGSKLLIACSEDTQTYIAGRGGTENIAFLSPSHPLTPRGYICNFLELLAYCCKDGAETIFVHCRTLLTSQVPIQQEVRDQGFAVVRKTIDGHEDRPDIRYTADIVYVNSTNALSSVDKYFRSNGIFDESKEQSDEPTESIVDVWRNMPARLLDMDDGKLTMTYFIDGSGYLTTENFFAFEKKWELNQLTQGDNVLHHDGNHIWGIRIEMEGGGPVLALSRQLIARVIAAHRWMLPILELRFSPSAAVTISTPPKAGILHWDRRDSHFYMLVSSLCESSQYFATNEAKLDYFVLCNYVLLDRPGTKWLTNRLQDVTGIIYFDYDNELLDAVQNIGRPSKFGGYAVPFPDVLEQATPSDERDEDSCFEATDETFTENEERYAEFLAELSRHGYAQISADTPKHRIAECARLGVVPRIDAGVQVVELPDLLSTASTFADKVDTCMRYYDTHLSVQSISAKLLSTIFDGIN